jgi:hypothetical protein
MFPGRTPEKKARDEDSTGQDPPRIPKGPIDLDSGVLRLEPRRDTGQAASPAENPSAETPDETD